ncbi:hypothetical protein BGZ95_000758 [Linnemannia exigua]|uniref:Uncharacterized protein n=1 Tax=Linnemannia exigua TaxID=604196 RepID=A0AAD4D7S9_9FUNG|nr:hypothetical protein BGZ95_000758 [Linnemannia exigua]
MFALWTRYPSYRTGISTETFGDAGEDYATHDPEITTLPPRAYAPDEKYLILEYSPWLGFNNMRYMIERGLYLSNLLNRTLVLPTDLRIRSCSDFNICAQVATYLTPGSANSRNEQESVFQLDLGYFFDLPHLAERTGGRVIGFRRFMEEIVGAREETLMRLRDVDYGVQVFFELRGKKYSSGAKVGGAGGSDKDDVDMGEGDEVSDRGTSSSKDDIHDESNNNSKERQIVLKTVQRKSWDLAEDPSRTLIDNIIRNGLVDTLREEDGYHPSKHKQVRDDGSVLVNRSFYAFADVQGGGVGRIVSWSVQFQYPPMSDSNKEQDPSQTTSGSNKGYPLLETCRPPPEDPSADQIPWESRFPGFATCHIENYVGLAEELGPIDADVLVVEGQFHTTGWIPLVYSSLENAQNHRLMALTYLMYSPVVHEAADYLMAKLKARIQRRQQQQQQQQGKGVLDNDDANPSDYSWLQLSIHVRRGDFVSQKHGWQKFDDNWMGSLVKDAVESIFGPIGTTLDISSTTPVSNDERGIDTPQDTNHQPHQQIQTPRFGFYMSTDESSPQILDYFQSLGAILFEDLLDDHFESRFGHLIVFDDWIGLVEQLICARAGMFYGTMSSSFSSGILNMRMDGEVVDGGKEKPFGYLYKAGGPVLTPEQQQQG